MKKLLLLIYLVPFFLKAQTVVTLSTADTSKIVRTTGTTNAELILRNSTRSVTNGLLYNAGNGWMKYAIIGNGIIGGATVRVDSSVFANKTWVNGRLLSYQASGNYITALTGDVTASGPGSAAATLATVNSNVGSFGSATQTGTFTVNGKGLITAASNTTITPGVGSITGLGTGVATALGVNVGASGSFVVLGGALGAPSSGNVQNLTGTASININGTVGATTPTTGVFTTVTTPSVIGGSAAGSQIVYKSTTGSGTASGIAHQFTGGTNGGTTILTMLNNGFVGLKETAPGFALALSRYDDESAVKTYSGIDGQAGLHFYRLSTGNNERFLDLVSIASGDGGVAGGSNIRFLTHSTSATVLPTERMRINRNGVINITNLSTNGVVYTTGGTGVLNSAARTIWGQNFDGSANVSGAFSGATTGAFSDVVTIAKTDGFATLLFQPTTGTNAAGMQMNTTGNTTYIFTDNSAGDYGPTNGLTPYATNIRITSNRAFQVATNDILRMSISGAGATTFSGTLGINGTADNVKGTTYAPTKSNETNVSSLTINQFLFSRTGEIVTATGDIAATAAATGTVTFYLTLPVSSNIASDTDANGGIFGPNQSNSMIFGYAADDKVVVSYTAPDTSLHTYKLMFQYIVK